MYLVVFVLGILGASAILVPFPPNTKFSYRYITYDVLRNAECNICFGEDCLIFEPAQCKYYMEAEDVVSSQDDETLEPVNPVLQNEVDSMMFDIVEKAQSYPDLECIPYISRYTDCTKENACQGCQTCHCMETGTWNCTTARCTTMDPDVDVDHRVLVKLIESLNENEKYYRKKRDVTDMPIETVNNNAMSLEELSEIIYGAPLRDQEQENHQIVLELADNNKNITVEQSKNEINEVKRKVDDVTTAANNVTSPTIGNATKSQPAYNNTTPSTFEIIDTTIPSNPDYIAFEEVLNDIAFDTKTRRKPPLDIVSSGPQIDNTTDFDYMLIDDYKDNVVPEVPLVQENKGTEAPQEDVTKIVIDLLESATKDGTLNETDYIEVAANKENLVGLGFDNNNAISDYDTLNLMKRDVSKVSEPNNQTDVKVIDIVEVENGTDKQNDKITLKEHILLPLIKFINSKRNELDDLKVIKDNLIAFMTHHNQSPIIEIMDYPNISDTNILHDLEMFPDLLNDFRRRHPAVMEKFLIKLKADIYEVIKDILGIQRFRHGKISDDMNVLIHTLKRYITKSTEYQKRKLKTKKRFTMFRRRYDADANKFARLSFKQCMIEIIQAIDRDMPNGNALAPLSPAARKIIKHILKIYYIDGLTNIELKIHDPKHNMTSDLHVIGNNWHEMSSLVLDSSPIITLYKIKLLHVLMMKDIEKMKGTLYLTNFSQNRRMMMYLKKVNETLVDQIDDGINSVQSNMQVMVEYYSKQSKKNQMKHKLQTSVRIFDNDYGSLIKSTVSPNKHKKRSFIKHILNMLKSSKHEKLLEKKIPRSEIVKQLARKKLDELAEKRFNEYEETMKKWQKSLGVKTRQKRNSEDQLLGRIKNIIPKYLRHKVHPKLQDKKNLALKAMNKTGKKKKVRGGYKRTRTTLMTAKTTAKIPRISTTSPTARSTTTTSSTTVSTRLSTASIKNTTH